MMLERLLRQFVWEYNAGTSPWKLTEGVSQEAGSLFAKALFHQFGEDRVDERIRLSGLGYPNLYQLLPLFGYGKEELDMKTLKTFMRGELLEIYTYALLKSFWPELQILHNPEIEHNGHVGHPDLVIKLGEETTIVECKSVSKFYLDNFCRDLPDDRGYVTQLLVYMHVKNVDVGYFFIEAEEDKSLEMVRLIKQDHLDKIQVAMDKLSELEMLKTLGLEEALSIVDIPKPVPAFIKNNTYAFPTVDPQIKYSPHLNCIYELSKVDGSTRPEVLRTKTPKEIVECLQKTKTQLT